MKNSKTEKLLKALSPLSCAETRRLFSRILRNDLDQEQGDWGQEHLTLCDECLLLLTDMVENQVGSGALPIRQFPDNIPLPPMEAFFHQHNVKERVEQQTGARGTSQLQDFNLHALKTVDSMTSQADLRPEQIRRRLLNVGIILSVGVVGIIVTLLSIGAGFPTSEPAHLLTVFLLIGSLALTFASSLAFALTTWSAFVYQYVRVEKKKKAIRTLLDAVIDLGREPNFDRAVLNLLIEELCNTAVDATERSLLDQAAKFISALDLRDTKIGDKFADLLCDYLARREDVSRLLDEEESIPRAA